MYMIIAQTPKNYFGSDIQKSLASLPGFPWAKYPGEKHLPGHNYTGPGTRFRFSLGLDTRCCVLKEPVRNLANDADLAGVRVVARNTIERVARAANHGFEKRVLQYNNIVENNRWGNYVNWKLYPLFGLLEHRKVSIGLPYKIHLQREINDDKLFFGENGSDAKLEITNLQLFIPVITPSIEVETRIFNSLTKDIEIAFLHRNTVGSMTLTGESTTWPITNTIKPARYLIVGFKNLPDSQTNNNNVFRVAMNQTQDPLIHKVQVRLNNDNYPNQPLTINPTTKDYNELYRNYKNMCELFGNLPQFEYVDFALNHQIFCFDLSAHQEDLFKTGVNINIHIEKNTRRCNRLLFTFGKSKTFN
ncbi:hypothetical protein LOTGIDRAFT_161030 [Lottia gigantea]|uniref:Double jelly roll-like domain-containing protein n=1 Tax=Lottia gigantea TaxID=225164 RepID=V4C031_LOTGI|nr:hypothetical protein LOTGIDRAFT_161030 [Lottia gigantea]ESO94779.1 hypothetical protein LOTGIDRAFT_161030 [Lottia gigantea]